MSIKPTLQAPTGGADAIVKTFVTLYVDAVDARLHKDKEFYAKLEDAFAALGLAYPLIAEIAKRSIDLSMEGLGDAN